MSDCNNPISKTAISLGWDCGPAVYGVEHGLRNRKTEGYNTCPFDKMITNYKGIIQCIEDNFQYFCDPEYLRVMHITDKYYHLNFPLNTTIIVNTKYNFIFNHESADHANLWQTEQWPKGQYHYEMDNFYEFIQRYKRRIQNFRDYLNGNYYVTFLLTRHNNTLENSSELNNAIKEKYPNLKYEILLIEESRKEIFNEGLYFMNSTIHKN
jgi:hypothetical protein